MNKKVNAHKSSIGNLDANVVAVIAYIGGGLLSFFPGLYYFSWVVPLVIFIIEKKSNFVKKNALQSLTLQTISSIIMFLLYGIISSIVRNSYNGNPWSYVSGVYSGLALIGTITTIITIFFTIIIIIAVIRSYNYKDYSIPLIGIITKTVEKTLNKLFDNAEILNNNVNEKEK